MSTASDDDVVVDYVQTHNIHMGDFTDFLDAGGHFVSRAEVLGVREDLALVRLITHNLVMEVRKHDLLKLIPYEGSEEQKEDLAKRERREQELESMSFAKIMELGL